MRAKLLARRAGRIRPGFDDKVLADWNGLMIAALAKAADAFERPDWLEAAEQAFDFIRTRMTSNGRLFHAYRAGEAKAPANATDYANMIKAALALASVTGKSEYIDQARDWVEVLEKHYRAEGHGGYYIAADDTDDLIVRPLNARTRQCRTRTAPWCPIWRSSISGPERSAIATRAEEIVTAFAGDVGNNVFQHTGLLAGAIDLLAPAHIVIVVPEGGDAKAMRRALAHVSLPGAVVQEVHASVGAGESLPETSPAHGKTAIDGKPTAYVCIGPQCSAPVTDPAALVEAVRAARQIASPSQT